MKRALKRELSRNADEKLLQMQAAMENVKTGFAIIGINRRIIFINEPFAGAFGYSSQELMQSRITDLIPRISFRFFRKWFKKQETIRISHPIKCVTRSGDKVDAEIQGSLVANSDGAVTGAVITLDKILKDSYRVADIAGVLGYEKTSIIRFEREGLIPKARRDKYGWRFYSRKEFNSALKKIQSLRN